MPTCAAYDCTNRTGKGTRQKLSFFAFPLNDSSLLKIWLHHLGRKDFSPSVSTRVCELHFEETQFLEDLQLKITGTPLYKYKRRIQGSIPKKFRKGEDGTWCVGPPQTKPSACVSAACSSDSREARSADKTPKRKHTVERLQKQEHKQILQDLLEDKRPVVSKVQKKDEIQIATPKKTGQKLKPNVPCMEPTCSSTNETQVFISSIYGNPKVARRDHSYAGSSKEPTITSSDLAYTDKSEVPKPTSNSPAFDLTSKNQNVVPTPSIGSEIDIPASSGDESDMSEGYLPSSAGESTEGFITEEETERSSSQYFLVYEENLSALMRRCQECGAPVIETSKKIVGTLVVYTISCHEGHSVTWASQPSMHRMPLGNLMLAAATLYTGLTYARISALAKALNLAIMGKTTFHDIQKSKLHPVVQEAWSKEQRKLYDERKDSMLQIAGDCRCDSPGHCAKYGTYSLMDTGKADGSNKILNVQLVQCTEVRNSNQMEPEGLRRALQDLKTEEIKVDTLATDRHIQIKKIMATDYSDIDHQFDVWHVAKSVVKKLNEKAKLKRHVDLLPWIQCVSNHLWWSCATCGGDEQSLRERWISILHHVINKHRWSGSRKFKRCSHPRLSSPETRPKAWLNPDSASFEALKAVVMDKNLLSSLPKLARFCHTGNLETFHNVMLKYCPKRQHFGYEGMKARTLLAALDWNSMKKSPVLSVDGTHQQEQVYSKRRRTWVLRYKYHREAGRQTESLMERTIQVYREKITLPPMTRPDLAENISRLSKPSIEEALDHYRTRFMDY